MAEMTGPLFNGEAERLAAQACAAIEQELGRQGEALVRQHLDAVLQNPTGYYESQITSQADGGDIEITDGGVVYGPWLEGTGSRNRTTRFKGYATFRRVTQVLQGRARATAERVAAPFVGRMG